MAAAAGATTEAGRRLRDMLEILRKRAPRLRPNTVPRSCWPFFDDAQLGAWAPPANEGQRRALVAALEGERRKALGSTAAAAAAASEEEEGAGGGLRLALTAEVDADSGVCHIRRAKYVSEVEADLHSVAAILNLHGQGESDELRLRLDHFCSVNGLQSPPDSPSDPLREAQEIYSLAYAITVCLSAAAPAAVRATVGPDRLPLPLPASADVKKLVSGLFAGGAQLEEGRDGGGGGKRKRKGLGGAASAAAGGGGGAAAVGAEEQGAGDNDNKGKKRRRKGKGKGEGEGEGKA